MERFMAAIGWIVEQLGRYPIEDDLGLGREIAFAHETSWSWPNDEHLGPRLTSRPDVRR